MKKKLLILFIFYCKFCFGQNLIPNGSFEQYNNCPIGLNNLSDCADWQNFGNSPDYYNTCGSYCLVPPNTCFAYQNPHTGNAYSGIGVYTIPGIGVNYREFIGVNLLTPLVTGMKYYISFYVSNAGKYIYTLASNKIGVKGSSIPYSNSNPPLLTNTANFYTDSIISDTLNWVQVKGSFIADSNYQYLIIGNFFDDLHTDTLGFGQINHAAYYLIDDVCLGDSLTCFNYTGVNELKNHTVFEVNPLLVTDYCNIKVNNSFIKTITIYSSIGKNILIKNMNNNVSEYSINTASFASGLYMIIIETKNNLTFTKNIIINH